MSYLTKFTLILVAICLGLGIGLIGLSQDTTLTEESMPEVELDEEVEPEDLEVKEPKILPGSRLYFLKEWGRGILSFFAFGRIKKSELEQKFANERLMELKALVEQNGDPEILEKATEKYERALERIRTRVQNIKKKAEEDEDVSKFLDKFTKHQLLHQKVLQKLEEQVPSEVFEKIKAAREKHLERFGEVMTKLENRAEKIRENLEKNMDEIEGSKFKNFKNLETLIDLEEKIPEQAKEAIQGAQENALKKLKDDLEKMSPEDQERFKEYIDKISGDKAKQLQILENLRFELRERTELREQINELRQGLMERIQQMTQQRVRACPEIERPVPGFCSEGRIIAERNETGCVIEFKCVFPAEAEISAVETEPTACITLWDPVCGNDGKTYSNTCFARAAGVGVASKGVCKDEGAKETESKAEGLRRQVEQLKQLKETLENQLKALEGSESE